MPSHPTFDIKPELIASKISNSQSILITSHHNPDGDAIGSALAFYHYLSAIGKKSKILLPNAFPVFLNWMEGSDRIILYDSQTRKARKLIEGADLIFCLDFNSFSRTKFFEEELQQSRAYKILIDHHPQPSDEFDHLITRVEVSSTAELVYETIAALGHEGLIDKKLAECLYSGILTDTGSFSFSCNYPSTFRITASLIEKGIDAASIHERIYDNFTEQRMRLLGYCISEKLAVLKDYATAYVSLTKHELDHFNFQQGDTEGIVNYALAIEKTVMAVLFTEKDEGVRVSLRSKGSFSVNDFARKHFKGGGHQNAAGADSDRSLDETISYFVSLLQDYKEELKQEANKQ
jgi:bifunctional oligoribonuclease and PAP phosphatase NrnA